MPTIDLAAGTIAYTDSGGDGPTLVFTHGLPMDGEQWREVVPLLPDYRCLRPTLPMGAHQQAMHRDADLGHLGQAAILADFIDALDLTDVTLVVNDWGGAQHVVSERRDHGIARMVLVACEAFDNVPPGAAKQMAKALRVPGAAWLMFQAYRWGWVRRLPMGHGGLSLRGIPDDLMDAWFTPARRDRAVRRDFVKFATSTPARDTLLTWAERLADFDRPVLVVWGADDPFMPPEHGPRLADLYPDGRLVVLDDASTLIPLDQPERLAALIRSFVSPQDADVADGSAGPSGTEEGRTP